LLLTEEQQRLEPTTTRHYWKSDFLDDSQNDGVESYLRFSDCYVITPVNR